VRVLKFGLPAPREQQAAVAAPLGA